MRFTMRSGILIKCKTIQKLHIYISFLIHRSKLLNWGITLPKNKNHSAALEQLFDSGVKMMRATFRGGPTKSSWRVWGML